MCSHGQAQTVQCFRAVGFPMLTWKSTSTQNISEANQQQKFFDERKKIADTSASSKEEQVAEPAPQSVDAAIERELFADDNNATVEDDLELGTKP